MWQNVNSRGDLNVKQNDMLASKRFVIERKPDTVYFYELEEAVVLDIVLNETHPKFTDPNSQLDPNDWPPNIDGSAPIEGDKNYGLMGRIKFRFLHSELGANMETLNWAIPIENTGITEYPLLNEVVIVGKYMDNYFYSRKLNTKQVLNSNAAFVTERISGYVDEYVPEGAAGKWPKSNLSLEGGKNYDGYLGQYFKFNPKIRSLKRYEGDTILESRFGSTIRFGAYDDNRGNDNGKDDYSDGGGNPMILIRNRQAPITLGQGYTAKGYTVEDINKDGSSIQLTSGQTVSKFQSSVSMPMISGKKKAEVPELKGDQIVINSDRLVFSSKANEMLFFSKKRIGMTTDAELTLSALERITISTTKTATINAQQIFLGDHAKIYEPALLGRSTVAWMYAMCDWMLLNVNTQIQVVTALITHFHVTKVGPTTPAMPPAEILWPIQLQSLLAQQISLLALRSQLSSLMSSRVFMSGGED